MLNVSYKLFMLNIAMLSVVMLTVVTMSVVAPLANLSSLPRAQQMKSASLDKALALLANIRLSWIGSPWKSTLACY
jgi:hypothetical protein